MIYPHKLIFKKKLVKKYSEISNSDLIDFGSKNFIDSGVDQLGNDGYKIKCYNKLLSLKIKSGMSWNRWMGIEKATYEIIERNNIRIAVFKADFK